MAIISILKNDIETLYTVLLSIEDTAKVDAATLLTAGFFLNYTNTNFEKDYVLDDINNILGYSIGVTVNNDIIICKKIGYIANKMFGVHRDKDPAIIEYDSTGNPYKKLWYLESKHKVADNAKDRFINMTQHSKGTSYRFNVPIDFDYNVHKFYLDHLQIDKENNIVKSMFTFNFNNDLDMDKTRCDESNRINIRRLVSKSRVDSDDFFIDSIKNMGITVESIDDYYNLYKRLNKEQLSLIEMCML